MLCPDHMASGPAGVWATLRSCSLCQRTRSNRQGGWSVSETGFLIVQWECLIWENGQEHLPSHMCRTKKTQSYHIFQVNLRFYQIPLFTFCMPKVATRTLTYLKVFEHLLKYKWLNFLSVPKSRNLKLKPWTEPSPFFNILLVVGLFFFFNLLKRKLVFALIHMQNIPGNIPFIHNSVRDILSNKSILYIWQVVTFTNTVKWNPNSILLSLMTAVNVFL